MNPAASAERSCRCRGCCTFLRDCAETELKVSRVITRRIVSLCMSKPPPRLSSAIVFGNIVAVNKCDLGGLFKDQ
jgi:hypothetical protein